MGDILDSAVTNSQVPGASTPPSSAPILDSLVVPSLSTDNPPTTPNPLPDSTTIAPPVDPVPQPITDASVVAPIPAVPAEPLPIQSVTEPSPSPIDPVPQPVQSSLPVSDSVPTVPPSDPVGAPPANGSSGSDEFSPAKPKKRLSGTAIIVGMLLLLIALPVAVYYISQQQSLNDIRNRALYSDLFPCSVTSNNCPAGTQCHCQGGDACTSTKCEPIEQSCKNQGRAFCVNMTGNGYTCCVAGYKCCDNVDGCCKDGNPPNLTPTDKPPGEDTPTPTVPMTTNTITHTPTHTPSITVTLTDTPTHTPTNTPVITDTPTHTPTNTMTPTATPTSIAGCNEACTVNTDCASGTVCADGRCRNPQCTESSTCQCATNTNTPTPTPTLIAFVGCNSACTVNTDCSSGLVCIDSFCRNPSCTEKTSCQCDIASAPTPQTPVAGTGPSVLGASVIAGGFLLVLLGLAL